MHLNTIADDAPTTSHYCCYASHCKQPVPSAMMGWPRDQPASGSGRRKIGQGVYLNKIDKEYTRNDFFFHSKLCLKLSRISGFF
jgi:hypothetical protein